MWGTFQSNECREWKSKVHEEEVPYRAQCKVPLSGIIRFQIASNIELITIKGLSVPVSWLCFVYD